MMLVRTFSYDGLRKKRYIKYETSTCNQEKKFDVQGEIRESYDKFGSFQMDV